MEEHPIQSLMKTAMENIKEMVDVNTIVGDAVEAADGTIIIPISRVSFGFAAGGTQFDKADKQKEKEVEFPFGGGSGGGVTVQPVAFLVVGQGSVRLLPVDSHAMLDRLIDLAPQLMNQIENMLGNKNKRNNTQM